MKRKVMQEVFERLNRKEEHLRDTGIESPDDLIDNPESDDFHRIKKMDMSARISHHRDGVVSADLEPPGNIHRRLTKQRAHPRASVVAHA